MMCLMLLYLLCFTLQVRYKIRLAGTRLTKLTVWRQIDFFPTMCSAAKIHLVNPGLNTRRYIASQPDAWITSGFISFVSLDQSQLCVFVQNLRLTDKDQSPFGIFVWWTKNGLCSESLFAGWVHKRRLYRFANVNGFCSVERDQINNRYHQTQSI